MFTFTYEQIFEEQLKHAQPLSEDSIQITEQRKDYFDEPYQVGDIQLFVQFVNGKMSGYQHTSIDFGSITPRSWDTLLEHYIFEPMYDHKNNQAQRNVIPRFVHKPTSEGYDNE